MKKRTYKEDKVVTCINCITGKTEALTSLNGTITNITEIESRGNNIPFVESGLIDLQINGINGEYRTN